MRDIQYGNTPRPAAARHIQRRSNRPPSYSVDEADTIASDDSASRTTLPTRDAGVAVECPVTLRDGTRSLSPPTPTVAIELWRPLPFALVRPVARQAEPEPQPSSGVTAAERAFFRGAERPSDAGSLASERAARRALERANARREAARRGVAVLALLGGALLGLAWVR